MTPEEYQWFRSQIENTEEEEHEIVLWQFARLPDSRYYSPKYFCAVQTGEFDLKGFVSIGHDFGAGSLEIPMGMFNEKEATPDMVELIRKNRAQFDDYNTYHMAVRLGIRPDFRYGGDLIVSLHSPERLYGSGWSFDLIRFLSWGDYHHSLQMEIQVPGNHHELSAIAAYGLVRYIRTHLPHLQITPLSTRQFLNLPED